MAGCYRSIATGPIKYSPWPRRLATCKHEPIKGTCIDWGLHAWCESGPAHAKTIQSFRPIRSHTWTKYTRNCISSATSNIYLANTCMKIPGSYMMGIKSGAIVVKVDEPSDTSGAGYFQGGVACEAVRVGSAPWPHVRHQSSRMMSNVY